VLDKDSAVPADLQPYLDRAKAAVGKKPDSEYARRVAFLQEGLNHARTCVETAIATALGASVQPLTNSAASINSRTGIRGRIPSGILDGYPFKDVSHILAPVGGALHMLVNLAPLNDMSHVGRITKKLSDG
jgi:hypothetical protein